MAKRVQDTKPPRTDDVMKWFKQNVAEQKKRHRAIAKEMNDLAPARAKWYKRFLKDITTTGFNVNGDMKRIIKKSELPTQPKRKERVTY